MGVWKQVLEDKRNLIQQMQKKIALNMFVKQVIVLYHARIRYLGIICTLRNYHFAPALDHMYMRL